MVQSKKKQTTRTKPEPKATAALQTRTRSTTYKREIAGINGLRLHDYLMINAAFIVLCIVQLLIVRLLIRDFAGLFFFFGFLICAFAIASIFDYFSERLGMGVTAGEPENPAND